MKRTIKAGRAQMRLLTAVICGDDDLANQIATAVTEGRVIGDPAAIQQLTLMIGESMIPARILTTISNTLKQAFAQPEFDLDNGELRMTASDERSVTLGLFPYGVGGDPQDKPSHVFEIRIVGRKAGAK